jgi:hypothetical protein
MKKTILSLLVAVGLIGSASSAVLPGDLTYGLVAYWQLNGNANDSSGNDHNLSAPNGINYVLGRNGNLTAEMTNNKYFRLSQAITLNNSFTWSIWFQPLMPTETYIAIMSQGFKPLTPPTVNPYLSLNDLFWTPEGGITGVAGGSGVTSAPLTLTSNQWYNVIWTSDGIGNRSLFVNGSLSGTITGTVFGDVLDNFYIGGTPQLSADTGFFNGYIDNVSIYNRGLSSSEVSQLYTLQSAPEPSTYALFGIGAIGMLMVLRRKKNA